jgi:hypothetical protein
MHWLYAFFYVEAKFGPLERKGRQKADIDRVEIFQNTIFLPQKEKEILDELKAERFDDKLSRY